MISARSWHLDRRIPLGVIAVLICNILGGVWMASKYDSTLNDQGRRLTVVEQQTNNNAALFSTVSERLARIEGQLLYLVHTAKGDK